MEYRIKISDEGCVVHEGYMSYGCFISEGIVFTGTLANCYAWIKAKQEGLLYLI